LQQKFSRRIYLETMVRVRAQNVIARQNNHQGLARILLNKKVFRPDAAPAAARMHKGVPTGHGESLNLPEFCKRISEKSR
jgi:hypothetical protein